MDVHFNRQISKKNLRITNENQRNYELIHLNSTTNADVRVTHLGSTFFGSYNNIYQFDGNLKSELESNLTLISIYVKMSFHVWKCVHKNQWLSYYKYFSLWGILFGMEPHKKKQYDLAQTHTPVINTLFIYILYNHYINFHQIWFWIQ